MNYECLCCNTVAKHIILLLKSPKSGWLLLKALWKPVKYVICNNTKFCNKLAYVGCPCFRRRPSLPLRWAMLPRLHNFSHSPCNGIKFICLYIPTIYIVQDISKTNAQWNAEFYPCGNNFTLASEKYHLIGTLDLLKILIRVDLFFGIRWFWI